MINLIHYIISFKLQISKLISLIYYINKEHMQYYIHYINLDR